MLSLMIDMQQEYAANITGIVGVSLLVFLAWLGFYRTPLPRWTKILLASLSLVAALILFCYLLLASLRRFP